MNYKKCKKHKRKVEMRYKWSCNKQNILNIEEKKNKQNKYLNIDLIGKFRSKSKYPCKKNKGDHIYEPYKEKTTKWWFIDKIELHKCKVCGKIKYNFKKD